MDPALILSVIQIIASVAAIVIIFIGLRKGLKKLDPNNESKTAPPGIIKKSTQIIVTGILCYALARFAANYFPMMKDQYTEPIILLQSLWQATYTLGFIALIPYLINKLQLNRISPPKD